MTAFFFISATRDARSVRRVDLATLASLFAEAEEPAVCRPPGRSQAVRLATIGFLLIGIVGDTLLVGRPKLLADVFAAMPSFLGTPRGA